MGVTGTTLVIVGKGAMEQHRLRYCSSACLSPGDR
jgi:hypothetical protein